MNAALTIDEKARRAREDPARFSEFAEENRAWILKRAGNALHRFITESDDAWSDALQAFYEAVNHYSPGQGHFLPFADTVIRRRMQDYLRKLYREEREIPTAVFTLDMPDEENTHLPDGMPEMTAPHADPAGLPIQDEITALGQDLAGYGFSFFDLAKASPKAGKTKRQCAKAVGWMLQDAGRIRKMQKEKTLPAGEITADTGIPKKTIERHRRYIIAAVEILSGDYPQLGEYMHVMRPEAENESSRS